MKSILIRDTTREEREQIVRRSLWGDCGIECEFCSGCDNRGGGTIDSLYKPYIDGEKEIAQINAEYRARYVKGDMMDEADSRTPGCGMGGQY